MPSELVQTFIQSGGLMRSVDIRFLLNNRDITNEDIEYILQYIEDNADSTIPIHMNSMMEIARRVLFNRKRIDIVKKFVNEESIWTPYLLGVGLDIDRYFPDKLELYRKYSYQIFLIISNISRSRLTSLQSFDPKSSPQHRSFYTRLIIKCYIDDLDHITLNRLDLIMEELFKIRDKYEIYLFISTLFKIKDINNRMKECLYNVIMEFCNPSKRRCYNSAFLRALYENMNDPFRFNFHRYIENLYEEGLLDKKDFIRFDKAYLESAEI